MLVRHMTSLVVLAASSVVSSAACSSAPPDPTEGTSQTDEALADGPADAHVQAQKGAKPGGTSGGPLIDHGGTVLPASHVYTFWWGTQSAFPSDAKTGIAAMFEGLNGSALLSVANQYMRGGSTTTSYVSSYDDTSSSPPTRSPSTSTIANEACHVINANGLTPDPDALYLVYTSNFPGHTSYCAWHSNGTCNGVNIKVAYMPNTTGIAGCDPGNLYNCNSYSQGTRSLANVSSHEYMETLTDADANAWYDSSGSEIGDKCAWQFNGCANLKSGSWMLQEEWSNSAGGCVQN
jgi:hypothetical protein